MRILVCFVLDHDAPNLRVSATSDASSYEVSTCRWAGVRSRLKHLNNPAAALQRHAANRLADVFRTSSVVRGSAVSGAPMRAPRRSGWRQRDTAKDMADDI